MFGRTFDRYLGQSSRNKSKVRPNIKASTVTDHSLIGNCINEYRYIDYYCSILGVCLIKIDYRIIVNHSHDRSGELRRWRHVHL